ncbi:hypothetical protein V8E54_013569 [Elaphomyces granulatus]
MAAPQQPISAPPAVQPVQAQLQAGNTQRVNWWDTLSRVWPSMGALVELDKRNRIIDGQPLPRPIRRDEDVVKLQLGERRYERELRQFASHGGPDTTNLINYQYPLADQIFTYNPLAPSSHPTANNRALPYDKNFEQTLEDIGIHLGDRQLEPMPNNVEGMKVALGKQVSQTDEGLLNTLRLDRFRRIFAGGLNVNRMKAETFRILATLHVPGDRPAVGVDLDNFSGLQGNTLATARPDQYYGLYKRHLKPEDLTDLGPIIASLNHEIVPSQDDNQPILPNLFVEFKVGNELMPTVSLRQVCHYGALGARAMQHLKSYGQPSLIFDNVASAFTVTICNGVLDIYTHHLTPASSNPDLPFECHMTHVERWDMKDNLTTLNAGVRAFRHVRVYAKTRRNKLINSKLEEIRATPISSESESSASECEDLETLYRLIESEIQARGIQTTPDP